ncbi:MAG: hypothetical protein FWD33_00740 [Alphaproteobacteria bacterium]|nr:hypothetical protein [Alphaproteobacteria bacterium]
MPTILSEITLAELARKHSDLGIEDSFEKVVSFDNFLEQHEAEFDKDMAEMRAEMRKICEERGRLTKMEHLLEPMIKKYKHIRSTAGIKLEAQIIFHQNDMFYMIEETGGRGGRGPAKNPEDVAINAAKKKLR